ncbi:YebC/PmpR family DNA-binding transcriptional regulator [Enterobacteriaceae endosymbiont of Plateumaris consimilis]|uniref:YebC/PmpR family DNA-binding transcriptional regulator n=1 Tax=Enterobacteriaceae endosymbiont of Plateumaris consimilis TaxID=2675794 RepID=UPI001449D18E|nr:YebC/PmpR family DNA-binding transcriptional regulator [Enterobacteriaceae endosymbiont of Plateumaris consimilis]QJC28820.1 YebC/PmpR family DNA-binding transcriptional regulator [Enterobacteriaceae endosymbiont of Plateumaris consimilis]
MAGHSKWSNMRYRKASQDIKKDRIFTKIIRELNTASKLGGVINPQYNTKLRLAIEKGLSNNMNKSTIEKILFKKLNKKKQILSDNIKNIFYEGFGPGNIALIINCITNNKNRTVSVIRNYFNKIGCHLGNSGSVYYMFKKKIKISFIYKNNLDNIIDMAEKLQAEDIIFNDKIIDIIFHKKKYKILLLEIKKFLIKPVKFKLTMIPLIKKNLDSLTKNKFLSFLNLLKLNNDIQEIYHDANI